MNKGKNKQTQADEIDETDRWWPCKVVSTIPEVEKKETKRKKQRERNKHEFKIHKHDKDKQT